MVKFCDNILNLKDLESYGNQLTELSVEAVNVWESAPFSNFKNLTSLCVMWIRIDNNFCQQLLANLTQLTELTITHCLYPVYDRYSMSNYGFTGENEDNEQTGHSISNLTNLRWLTVLIPDVHLGDLTLLHISRLNKLHILEINCIHVII